MAGSVSDPSLTASLRRLVNWRVTALISAFLISTFLLYIFFSFFGFDVYNFRSFVNYTLLVGSLGAVVSFFLGIAERLGLIYVDRVSTDKRAVELSDKIDILEAQVASLLKSQSQTKEEYADKIRPELESISENFFRNRTMQRIEDDVATRYGNGIDVSVKIREIKSTFLRAVIEIETQLIGQRTNQNTNLLLGLMFSASGIIVLGYVFYENYISGSRPSVDMDVKSFLLGFIPRITFVILVETVAFFFLSLYREDRGLIRYFRNELTNFESKFIALETAIRMDDKNSLSKILSIYANTERNFTIKKGDVLITQALREDDERLFDKFIGKMSNNFDLTKIMRTK